MEKVNVISFQNDGEKIIPKIEQISVDTIQECLQYEYSDSDESMVKQMQVYNESYGTCIYKAGDIWAKVVFKDNQDKTKSYRILKETIEQNNLPFRIEKV